MEISGTAAGPMPRGRELTSNTLKYVAIILMFFDHLFGVFFPDVSYLRIPGRVVMPIMCFFISEGYYYTSNLRKYIVRLLIFAVVSHFPFVLCFSYPSLNLHNLATSTSAFWGLALGLIALAAVKNERIPLWARVGAAAACCALALPADWRFVPVLWILSFGLFRGDFGKQLLSFAAIGIVAYVIPGYFRLGWDFYQYGIFLAIPLLALYKGGRGRKSRLLKWGFYIFYPAHLLLLFTARMLIGG